jgi:hypothetical protein
MIHELDDFVQQDADRRDSHSVLWHKEKHKLRERELGTESHRHGAIAPKYVVIYFEQNAPCVLI